MRPGIIGLGRLGSSIARALDTALADPQHPLAASVSEVLIHNRTPSVAEALASERLRVAEVSQILRECDPVFMMTDAAGTETLLREHAAALTEANPTIVTCVPRWAPSEFTDRWVATIPNVNLTTGQGATAVAWGPGTTPDDQHRARTILSAGGRVIETTLDKLPAWSALMGSAPATYAKLLETWADAVAARHDLDRDEAREVVRQTAAGTIALQELDGLDAAGVIERVAHPGGATERVLDALDAHFPAVAETMLDALAPPR